MDFFFIIIEKIIFITLRYLSYVIIKIFSFVTLKSKLEHILIQTFIYLGIKCDKIKSMSALKLEMSQNFHKIFQKIFEEL